MASPAIDSLRGILNGFRALNSKGIFPMSGTETDLLSQILLEVQALSLGGIPADNSVSTAKIVDGAVTDPKLAASFKQTLLKRNYLKNPNFQVIQSTASGTLANSLALPTASLGYLGETEWCIAASGGTPSYAFSAANESVTFTGAAGTTAIYLLQRLESRDVVRLANKLATMTLSAEISNSLLTSVTWEVYRPTTTANTHGTIASPTQTLIASGTWTVSSALTRYSATFTLPSQATNGLEVRLSVGAQTSGTWVISRLQLEEGTVASTFNCGAYSEELAKCQRYYELIQFGNGAEIGVGATGITFSPPDAKQVRFDWKSAKFGLPIANSSSVSTFFVAGVVATGSIGLSADTTGISLSLSASSGNTASSWTCVPVTSNNGFLSGSSHIP